MKQNTREKLLENAEILFARKGYYGTSINDVAVSVSVSKQGLLHHFPSKEKLYAEVLQRAADHLMAVVRSSREQFSCPRDQLLDIVEQLTATDANSVRVVLVIVRELLDNPERAPKAQKWFMKPFLKELEATVLEGQKQGTFGSVHPIAFIYQILGAIQYYLISIPTLQQLFSAEEFQEHQHQHIKVLQQTINNTLLEG